MKADVLRDGWGDPLGGVPILGTWTLPQECSTCSCKLGAAPCTCKAAVPGPSGGGVADAVPQLDAPHLSLFKELLKDRLVANLMFEGDRVLWPTSHQEATLTVLLAAMVSDTFWEVGVPAFAGRDETHDRSSGTRSLPTDARFCPLMEAIESHRLHRTGNPLTHGSHCNIKLVERTG